MVHSFHSSSSTSTSTSFSTFFFVFIFFVLFCPASSTANPLHLHPCESHTTTTTPTSPTTTLESSSSSSSSMSAASASASRIPPLFISHGGPNLYLTKDQSFKFYQSLGQRVFKEHSQLKAVVVFSAHWETDRYVKVNSNPKPPQVSNPLSFIHLSFIHLSFIFYSSSSLPLRLNE